MLQATSTYTLTVIHASRWKFHTGITLCDPSGSLGLTTHLQKQADNMHVLAQPTRKYLFHPMGVHTRAGLISFPVDVSSDR